ncbi:helix-turn-helix transcriptional regulator [Micrococcus terreus]|uniref:helix-turn-helix domain-containing protein n=1 Tax=Micrococcus terreus TaxID=574650 RepID=UPI0033DA85D0
MNPHLIGTALTLGILVRNARLEQLLSQTETAARARVSRSWLARVEDGHPGAELAPLLRLVDALDLRLALHEAVDVDDTDLATELRARDREKEERAEGVRARILAATTPRQPPALTEDE